MTKEEESEGRELQESEGWVAQVEPVRPKHPQENGEEQRSVKVVAVGPPTVGVLPEYGAAVLTLGQGSRVASRLGADQARGCSAPVIEEKFKHGMY